MAVDVEELYMWRQITCFLFVYVCICLYEQELIGFGAVVLGGPQPTACAVMVATACANGHAFFHFCCFALGAGTVITFKQG